MSHVRLYSNKKIVNIRFKDSTGKLNKIFKHLHKNTPYIVIERVRGLYFLDESMNIVGTNLQFPIIIIQTFAFDIMCVVTFIDTTFSSIY